MEQSDSGKKFYGTGIVMSCNNGFFWTKNGANFSLPRLTSNQTLIQYKLLFL